MPQGVELGLLDVETRALCLAHRVVDHLLQVRVVRLALDHPCQRDFLCNDLILHLLFELCELISQISLALIEYLLHLL